MRRMVWLIALATLCSIALFPGSGRAGNIPGLPALQPPDMMFDLQLQFSNDFFSVKTNQDDFRTQQFSLAGRLGDEWFMVFDQSILTTRGSNPDLPDPPGTEGRLDQQSLSLGYRIMHQQTATSVNRVLIGGGLRRYGNFDGARIQNGAHRLFNDTLVNLPYVNTERTDAVAWLRASHQNFPWSDGSSNGIGYWLDGTTLLSSDGQSDGTIGLFGIWRNSDWRIWTGPRADWRSGYDRDVVQRSTAEHEQGVTWVVALAFGPLQIESTEGLAGNENSFGNLVLSTVTNPDSASSLDTANWAYQVGFLMPSTAIQNQLRWSPGKWQGSGPVYSLVFDYRYGTDARDDAGTVFAISHQYMLGVEIKVANHGTSGWMQPYIMLGGGYRDVTLEGAGVLAGQRSSTSASGVLVSDAGLRFHLSGKQDNWRMQLVLGASGWFPLQEKQVIFNGQAREVLQSDAAWHTGLSFAFTY